MDQYISKATSLSKNNSNHTMGGCLFSIIKKNVNIYINCTTYIQIHTVLYSNISLLYCYPVAPYIASWKNYLDISTVWYWQYKGGRKWHSTLMHSAGGIEDWSRCGWHWVGLGHRPPQSQTALHNRHSSALKSTSIQKIMPNSLLMFDKSPYRFYVHICRCRGLKCHLSPSTNTWQLICTCHRDVMTSVHSRRGVKVKVVSEWHKWAD